MATFSIKDAFRSGWNVVKDNLSFWVAVLAVVLLVNIITQSLGAAVTNASVAVQVAAYLGIVVVQVLLNMGIIAVALQLHDHKKAAMRDLLRPAPLFGKFIVGSLLYALISIGGLVLLIVPGIIWSVMFRFFDYALIDKSVGPITALKTSAALTQGFRWKLLWFFLLVGLANIFVITIPITAVAMAHAYRKLSEQ